MPIKILDIGQCHMDGPRMQKLWQDELGAVVDRVDSGHEALRKTARGSYDLVLVNRVLDADGSSGLDVVRDLVNSGTDVPVMLVSDLPEAQEEAVALGAVRGFGKQDLDDPKTLELVKQTAQGAEDGGDGD